MEAATVRESVPWGFCLTDGLCRRGKQECLRHACIASRHPTEYMVECLQNAHRTAIALGTPAGHSRCPYPPHVAWGAQTRPCYCQTHSAHLGRTAASRDRFSVPRSTPAGGEGLDRSLVGAIGQRQTRQVLSP